MRVNNYFHKTLATCGNMKTYSTVFANVTYLKNYNYTCKCYLKWCTNIDFGNTVTQSCRLH